MSGPNAPRIHHDRTILCSDGVELKAGPCQQTDRMALKKGKGSVLSYSPGENLRSAPNIKDSAIHFRGLRSEGVALTRTVAIQQNEARPQREKSLREAIRSGRKGGVVHA